MKNIHSLRARVILYFTLLVIILSGAISFVVGSEYRRSRLTQYADLAFSYAMAAADYIDGDRVTCYLEDTQPDAYYQQVNDYLSTQLNRSTVLSYYYVFVPQGNTIVYVWDLTTYPGYSEESLPGGGELFEWILREKKSPEISLTNTDEYGSLASAYVPILDSNGEVSAIAGADISVVDINQKIGMFVAEITASVLLISIIAVVIIYQNIRRRIISPINTLQAATDNIVEEIENGQPFHVGIHTGDEIESLAHAFESMDAELRTYVDELSAVTAERERISAELDVARQIQTSLLPNSFPSRPEFEIYASMTPAKEVGGDFYDYFMPDDTHVAIVVADVSGKGLPASLFAVVAKTLIKDHTQAGSDPGSIFTTINRLLCESNGENMFVTAFEGILDLVSGEFRFVNAGHELPFIYRNGVGYQAYKIDSGFVLGGLENMTYQSGVIQLEPGDKIFQYTDGITEAQTGKKAYGMSRLEAALNRGANLSPAQLLPFIKTDIDTFTGTASQFDDITMLCLSYKARPTDS